PPPYSLSPYTTLFRSFLNPEDRMLWEAVYPERDVDAEISEGDTFTIAGTTLTALHTPGHSPGSTCFYAEDLGVLFSGDTLFNGRSEEHTSELQSRFDL